MKTLLAILLLVPSLSWGDTHTEKDTSLFCLLEPHVQVGDYPLVNRHAWWLKIYGGENYLVDALIFGIILILKNMTYSSFIICSKKCLIHKNQIQRNIVKPHKPNGNISNKNSPNELNIISNTEK